MPAPVQYLPRSDALLATWAINFSTLITATPTAYGLTSGQATTFGTAKTDYVNRLATASNPSTRTLSTVAAKNTSRAALLVLIRSYAGVVQAFPTITPTQLGDLGLTIRKTTPTPIPAPVTKPIVSPVGSSSNAVSIRMSDETTPDSRARPFGAKAMEVWASVGITPPAGPEATSFRGLATKNTVGPGSRAFVVQYDSGDVGKTAYMYGRWVNATGQPGPWSSLATATIAA
jgi:hypothetical protein